MAQETLNRLIAVMLTLSAQEQMTIIEALQDSVSQMQSSADCPYSIGEARKRLEIAKEQFRNGQFVTHEQVMQSCRVVAV